MFQEKYFKGKLTFLLNNSSSNLNISDLRTYITRVAEKELNKSAFLDTVTTGTITASYPRYYQVSLVNGGDVSSVNALPMNNDATYAINDYVYLLILDNYLINHFQ